MRASKLVLFLFIGLLLFAVVAVAALLLVDPSVFRGQLEARATKAFGRPFQIDGPIRLERSLRPRIVVEEITVGNPAWASREHFGKAERIGVQVALLPLLLRDLRVLDISFEGVDIFLEDGPDGANNYKFGDSDDREEPWGLPSVEQLLIRDAVIKYRSADATVIRYEINEARLWNIPGEPERIEGKGSIKDMPFTLLLVADTGLEQKPWSVRLDIQDPDMSLTIDGRKSKPFAWAPGDYHITVSGEQADSLETLFAVEFPDTGPFDISADVNAAEGAYRAKGLVGHVQGPSGVSDIKIANGEVSWGKEAPIHVELQGEYGDTPLSLTFESRQPIEVSSQTAARPIEARLQLADTKLDAQGTMIPVTTGNRFELEAKVQGDTLRTVADILGRELPKAGPYEMSFGALIEEGTYEFTDLEGSITGTERWKSIQIVGGNASAEESGLVKASMEAKLDNVPLSLSFQSGPEIPGESNTKARPVQFEVSTAGAVMKGDGSVVTSGDRRELQMAASIRGDRLDTLGSLVGVSLPRIRKYDLSANLSSGGGVHEFRDLKVQIGANRLTGSVRWEDKTPRPLLTGKLSSDRITLGELLDTASRPSSNTRQAGLPDRPINFDRLKDFDARLDLDVKRVADCRIPVEKVTSTVTVSEGKLDVPFLASLAGAPAEGQLRLTQRGNVSAVSLKATVGRIDAGRVLKQLELHDFLSGTVDAVNLDGSTEGGTLQAMLEQADMTLKVRPGNLSRTSQIAAHKVDVTFHSAEFAAHKNRPVTATVTGTIQRVPFNATVSGGRLAQMQRTDAPIPVRVDLQTADVQFKAEGSIERPFEMNTFVLNHEITGKEIEGLSPLIDLAVPLRGEFHAKGKVSARGSRITYEEDLRVGRSDLQASITVLQKPTRPQITGSVSAREIHLDDIKLFSEGEKSSAAANRNRVIPDYTIPKNALMATDLNLDIKAQRVFTGIGYLGDLVSKVTLEGGRFKSSLSITGFAGAHIHKEVDINAAVKPPLNRLHLNAKDLNYRFLQRRTNNRDLIEGSLDLYVDLSGPGATRRDFFGNADGYIIIIGGPGRISDRRVDLWAADLIPTLLSPRWQRQRVTEMNCMVAHVVLKEGLAQIHDLLIDTRRVTIAATGILDLETEVLDVLIAPRPKLPSFVSLANPVKITGTLSQPRVSVARLPNRNRPGRACILAGLGLVNPLFLSFAFSDQGTGVANPCTSAVERAYEAAGANPR